MALDETPIAPQTVRRVSQGIMPVRLRSASLRVLDTPDGDLETVRRGEFTSNQIKDPFARFNNKVGGTFSLIPPPLNQTALLRMTMSNAVLKPAIEAMVTNICGHGYRLEYVGDEGGEKSTEADKEAESIHDFMRRPNDQYSMMELMQRRRWDMEAIGTGYVEVAVDKDMCPIGVWHLPGHQIRITETDDTPTEIDLEINRFGKKVRGKTKRHFRRYIQRKGSTTIYFKEWGDPRLINPLTGKEDTALTLEDSATYLIPAALYHAGELYGIPRWGNVVTAIQGANQAELTNLDYFSENAIPAMAVAVAGGSLTQDTLDQLEAHFTALRGRSAANRIMVLEVFGDLEARGENGTVPPPTVKFEPLSKDRPKDGQFLEYIKAKNEDVRASFRLPPIFLGMAQEYTYATANASYDIAEGQVFGPARVADEALINDVLLRPFELKYWRVRSNPPRITDPKEIIDALSTFEDLGAMTPNHAIGLANELFDMNIPVIEQPWGGYPFAVVKELAVIGDLPGWEEVKPMARDAGDGDGDGVVPDDPTEPKAAADDPTPEEAARVVRTALYNLRQVVGGGHASHADEAIAAQVRERRMAT